MEQSILKSTKKILNVSADDTTFDLDIMTHINSAFSTLNDIGVGPSVGFIIEDEAVEWDEYLGEPEDRIQLSRVKTFVFLHTRLAFDPPATTFHINAVQEQMKEALWRLNTKREELEWVDPDPLPPSDEVEDLFSGQPIILDGGNAG